MFIHSLNMSQLEARIRKWGNGYGILLPTEELRRANLKENDRVVLILQKKKQLEQLFGLCHFTKPVAQLMQENKEGYDD